MNVIIGGYLAELTILPSKNDLFCYEYLLYTLVVLARFFELSNEIFGFIGPLRGWQQGNLTFETPKESKRSIFRSCQPRKGPINPKIELDYQKIKPKDQSM